MTERLNSTDIDRSHGHSLGQIFTVTNMFITASVGCVVMQFMET